MKGYTRKDAEFWFKRIAQIFGRSTGASKKEDGKIKSNVGAWQLGHHVGGYVIQEIINEKGTIDDVFSTTGLPPREFCECMYQIQSAIDIWQKQENRKEK